MRIEYREGMDWKDVRKHRLSFETAIIESNDLYSSITYDKTRSEDEDRYYLNGAVKIKSFFSQIRSGKKQSV